MLPFVTPSESRSLFVSLRYLSSIGLARTPCTVSSVDPPSTFGSAPLSSSRSTRSAWPLITATSNGVAPSGLFSLTFAPAASNARTAAMSPRRTANARGVVPALERACTSALRSISACTTGPRPAAAAHINAVCPFQVSFASIFAPASRSAFTASARSVRAANISGVSPARTVRFGSAPPFSSRLMIAALPLVAASASGVTP